MNQKGACEICGEMGYRVSLKAQGRLLGVAPPKGRYWMILCDAHVLQMNGIDRRFEAELEDQSMRRRKAT